MIKLDTTVCEFIIPQDGRICGWLVLSTFCFFTLGLKERMHIYKRERKNKEKLPKIKLKNDNEYLFVEYSIKE